NGCLASSMSIIASARFIQFMSCVLVVSRAGPATARSPREETGKARASRIRPRSVEVAPMRADAIRTIAGAAEVEVHAAGKSVRDDIVGPFLHEWQRRANSVYIATSAPRVSRRGAARH